MNRESDVKNITHSVALSAKEIFGESLISVILYGSYARGDYDIESDVDIMLLVDLPKAGQQDYRKKIIELSSNLSLFPYFVKYHAILAWKLSYSTYHQKVFWEYLDVLQYYVFFQVSLLLCILR